MTDMLSAHDLDRFAEEYYLNGEIDDTDIEELAQRHSIPAILRATLHSPRLLELGYGTGLITRELVAAGREVHVVEGSGRLVAHARERHAHDPVVMIESMFETFEPDELYDAVLALHVLEHVDDPVALTRTIATWLRPGGVMIAVTPNAHSIHRLLGVAMGLQERLDDLSARDVLVGHQRVYELADLEAHLTQAGLEVRSRFGYFVKPLSNRQMVGWSSEVLDGLNRIAGDVPVELCANIGVVCARP
ncbi:MAG TPA: class I SAM-dependent methyltransferase [Microthrixaceae bacterium]|jgi:2-polyprenyl-3-methyl-5-hydroxy-6-metoxy-1,4-benzoquinol methylase|nr:class I SAM-dependent methyltransferase [Actinomycetota bacterium]HMS12374.1 class I SAM-dependent methyltransferase [Microthrixaceae bacterium]HMT25449.1 class I SAM-dependent methyltransferase [Microthrixaceae bacterium]HMT61816.1 class I SAM-dependent methyltransferase [Microthrixaceae bacterium]